MGATTDPTHIGEPMTIDTAPTLDRTEEAIGAVADRVFASLLGALDVLTIHIGDQLGLYDLLHRRGPLDVAAVAAASGTHPRYAREWLEQQAVAGLIDVLDPQIPCRRAALLAQRCPRGRPLRPRQPGRTRPPSQGCPRPQPCELPRLLDAYRSGEGVGWSEYGDLMRTAQADANRPLFLQVLGSDWLPSVPELDAVLRDGGRVADIGCGDWLVLDRHRPCLPGRHGRRVRRRRGLGRGGPRARGRRGHE